MAGKQKKQKTRFRDRKWWQKLLVIIGWILLAIVIIFAILVITLSVTEFKPKQEEKEKITHHTTEKTVSAGDDLTVMTWNLGYGALGDNADFFMDGGSSVQTADEQRVKQNLDGIASEISAVNPDIALFQEVDTDSDRSHQIDETKYIADRMEKYDETYAYNYKVLYIPYPMPPIGKVNSGILTFSKYNLTDSTRVQLPCPFKWPVRLGNLKRCLDISRIPVEGSDKELVIVNLHLEAYDSGEGKAAQTQMLKEYLQKEVDAGNYVIAGGDFNQTFSNVDASAYPTYPGKWHAGKIDVSDFGDDWQMVMDNSTPSCRSLDQPIKGADLNHFQFYIIDGFIVSNNIDIDSVETQDIGFKNTDHNPVVMHCTLK